MRIRFCACLIKENRKIFYDFTKTLHSFYKKQTVKCFGTGYNVGTKTK